MRKTKIVKIRNIEIGGENPIAIQTMTNVDTRNQKLLLEQINRLSDAGAKIVRVAIPDMDAATSFGKVREKTDVPLVADIHFDYKLALAAIHAGADKIRINPGNIGARWKVEEVVKASKDKGIPIRVGVNSGSLEKKFLEKYGKVTPEGLAESALASLSTIEEMGYGNLVVSIKSSNPLLNYQAHKILTRHTDHPIHIGITEAGTLCRGRIKSAVGIGALLLEGIGDTMRVSLTADPVEGVIFAKEILQAAGLVDYPVNIVSCPTCGRTQIDLVSLADRVEEAALSENLPKGLKIAVMGCGVNGPGEAREADFGVAGGNGKGIIFAKGEIIKSVSEEEIVRELMATIKESLKND